MQFKLTDEFPAISGLQGYIKADYARLVEVFGEPNSDGDEYKVQKEWLIKFEDGTFATIYDWKEGDNYNGPGQGTHYTKVEDWHIGGHTRQALHLVQEALAGEHKLSTEAAPRYTVDQIANAAQTACFYVTPDGQWLRMQFCDNQDGYFVAMDEETGEDYRVYYSELVYETPEFHKLVQVSI